MTSRWNTWSLRISLVNRARTHARHYELLGALVAASVIAGCKVDDQCQDARLNTRWCDQGRVVTCEEGEPLHGGVSFGGIPNEIWMESDCAEDQLDCIEHEGEAYCGFASQPCKEAGGVCVDRWRAECDGAGQAPYALTSCEQRFCVVTAAHEAVCSDLAESCATEGEWKCAEGLSYVCHGNAWERAQEPGDLCALLTTSCQEQDAPRCVQVTDARGEVERRPYQCSAGTWRASKDSALCWSVNEPCPFQGAFACFDGVAHSCQDTVWRRTDAEQIRCVVAQDPGTTLSYGESLDHCGERELVTRFTCLERPQLEQLVDTQADAGDASAVLGTEEMPRCPLPEALRWNPQAGQCINRLLCNPFVQLSSEGQVQCCYLAEARCPEPE